MLSPPYQTGEAPRRAFLNVEEAAAELRLDASTLYRHLREGRFPGVRIGGRYLVPASVLDQLAEEAMRSGKCIDVEQWSRRWREEHAANVLAAGHLAGPPVRAGGDAR